MHRWLTLAALGVSTLSGAAELEAFYPDAMPVGIGLAGEGASSVGPGDTEAALEWALEQWSGLLDPGHLDLVADHSGRTPAVAIDDGLPTVSMVDFAAEELTGWVGIVTPFAEPHADPFIARWQEVLALRDVDLALDDGILYVTLAQAQAGQCTTEIVLETVMLSYVGQMLGLNPFLSSTGRSWTATPWRVSCVEPEAEPSAEELDAMGLLYGPGAEVLCGYEHLPGEDPGDVLGLVPMATVCALTHRGGTTVDTIEWHWGNGVTDSTSGLQAEYTYAVQGEWQPRANITGALDDGAPFESIVSLQGKVVACDVPEPDFTIQRVEGRTYLFRNDTGVSVHQCITEVQWDVFDELGELVMSLNSWAPEVIFEHEGLYRVVLNLGGPAGTAAAESALDVGKGACSCAAGPMGGWIVLLLAPLALRRRRG